jgi:hypothetical protein
VSDTLNRTHFLTFSNQCKRAGITAIDVVRADTGREVRLKYRGRDARTGRLYNGEWVLEKDGAGAAEAKEKAFFELAEKSFAVTRHED